MGFTFDLQRFDSAFSGGNGTENNPYLISSSADLQQLARDVNGGNDTTGLNFKLNADIDLSSVENFTPVGNESKPFKGTFDGDGHTIRENLQNGSLTGDDLDGVTINGEKVTVDDSQAATITVTEGKLISSAETVDSGTTAEEFLESLGIDNPITVNADNKNVTLSGGQAVVVEDISAKVSITASKGNDTIVSKGENVSIKLNSTGKTDLFALEGKMTLEGYDAATGTGFGTNYSDIFTAIENKDIDFDKGRLTIDSAVVYFDKDSELIDFYDAAGDLQKVGFASDDSKLDASKETGNLILVGASNSTLTGGKGKNQIYLDEDSESTILFNGKNTVENFNATFDYGDRISVDATNHDFNFDGENVSVKSGSARALLQNISSGDDAARILTVINGKETKAAIAQAGAIIATGDELADVYYGEKSGVDFTGFDESLTLDLRKNFYGINQVTVGSGLNTVISSSRNETLTGNSNATTEFIFNAGGGRDLIQSFNFDEDKINVGTDAITDVKLNSAGNVRLQVGGGEDWLTIEDAQGKNFQVGECVAQVNTNSLTYDGEANFFVATYKNATMTVGDVDSAIIWLSNDNYVGDIRTLDATASDGKAKLAGNDLDNTICAGLGDASLWGGNGGDDLLQGGNAHNLFFYCMGNGSDTIQSANDGDAVILSTVTLDQISGTNFTATGVAINFNDGGKLTVNGTADVTYQLADGSKFSANHEQATWIAK